MYICRRSRRARGPRRGQADRAVGHVQHFTAENSDGLFESSSSYVEMPFWIGLSLRNVIKKAKEPVEIADASGPMEKDAARGDGGRLGSVVDFVSDETHIGAK